MPLFSPILLCLSHDLKRIERCLCNHLRCCSNYYSRSTVFVAHQVCLCSVLFLLMLLCCTGDEMTFRPSFFRSSLFKILPWNLNLTLHIWSTAVRKILCRSAFSNRTPAPFRQKPDVSVNDARYFVENVFCRKCCNFKNIHRKILRFIP